MDSRLAMVLGTRPEIIKLAPIIKECEQQGVPYCVLHTGQHYSDRLVGGLFRELDLPTPDYTLDVGSGSHGAQTGQMISRAETVLVQENVDVVLVQGDTNSTLAGAVSASKLDVTLAHVEAGLRSYLPDQPEETNRRLVDHAADLHFAPTERAATNLVEEGISSDAISVTGNTVVDAIRTYRSTARAESTVLEDLDLETDEFFLLTVHRAENVQTEARFAPILEGVGRFAARTGAEGIFPIHPHARERLEGFGVEIPECVTVVEPVGYLDFLRLQSAAELVFTDSGGVQEETCVLGTPCVTLREATERPETLDTGANVLVGTDPENISNAGVEMARRQGDWENPLGDGTAARRILSILEEGSTSNVTDESVLARRFS